MGKLVKTGIDEKLALKFKDTEKNANSFEGFISEFLGQFLSKETKRAYLNDLNSFFQFVKRGGVTISHPQDIKSTHFQIYRDDLIEKNAMSTTINRKLVAVRSFIKWAMAKKLLDHNPLDAVKLPKVQNISTTQAFSDEEVLSMLAAPDATTINGQMHKMAMHLLFDLGLRRSELTHIKLEHIFNDRNHVVLKILGKGDKLRLLPLHKQLCAHIEEYLQFLRTQNIFLKASDYLLVSTDSYKNAKPVDGSTIFRIIKRYAKKLGINKTVGPHSCRATAISHLLDTQNLALRHVASFAGHANITTTERYDKRRDNLDNSAAYSIDYNGKKSA